MAAGSLGSDEVMSSQPTVPLSNASISSQPNAGQGTVLDVEGLMKGREAQGKVVVHA